MKLEIGTLKKSIFKENAHKILKLETKFANKINATSRINLIGKSEQLVNEP